MDAWSGGTFDSTRNRLVVWGGGHKDYAGNEVYGFDMSTLKWYRLTNPSIPNNNNTGVYADGTPSSRHTYAALAYLPNVDRMFNAGGAIYRNGYGNNMTWFFNFNDNTWQRKTDAPSPSSGECCGYAAAYDPITGHVFRSHGGGFSEYDPNQNTWTNHAGNSPSLYVNAAIAPVDRLMVAVGGGSYGVAGTYYWRLNPASRTMTKANTTGDKAVELGAAPGFAWSSAANVFVGWNGGSTVYTLDPKRWVWTKLDPSAANTVVPTAPNSRGTYGRFQYVPAMNVFVLVNRVTEDVYIYKPAFGGSASPAPTTTVQKKHAYTSWGWRSTSNKEPSAVTQPFDGGVIKATAFDLTVTRPTRPPPLSANTLQVGPGRQYTTIVSALNAAQDGDTIAIDAGVYTNETITISKNSLTLRGVEGNAHLKWGTGNYLTNTATITNRKGILVVQGNNVTIENLEFSGGKVADQNGAGIRYEGGNLTIRNSYFHDNENGILGQGGLNNTLLIENSVFERNGYCLSSCAHNVYIGKMGKLIFRYNKSIDAHEGHTLKSRAQVNEILSNYLSTKNSDGSYEADFPNGGTVYFIGNVVEQGVNTGNSIMLAYGEEGLTNPNPALYVVNNTFYNRRGSGAFLSVSGSPTLSGKNNIFAGGGSIGVISDASNKVLNASSFVSVLSSNYHLAVGSPAIDTGVSPGTAGTYDLNPQSEYVEPAANHSRIISGTAIDVGAYEFSSPASAAPVAP